MIAIIDYDAGNMKSVEKAFQYLNEDAVITRDRKAILEADRVVLPGVGAFGDAMERLYSYDLVETIQDAVKSGKPFLGICLGLQLLFNSSEETPGVKGLGLLPGEILRIPAAEGLKIPHMGWNSLSYHREPGENPHGRLFAGIPEDSYVYFVHSYQAVVPDEYLAAYVEYGTAKIPAMVYDGKTVYGAQFHPEKSGEVGLQILRNFGGLIG